MAYKTSYELHHHFPRLAEESGFTFNTHRPRVHIDWNKIKLIDLDSLIRERKFVLIEQHLNDILDCVFESEFDVRILDEGVMKMFRLAQLAVEYQQFCRHYLDRSVYVLKEEITSLAQELDATKKQLQDREEELRKMKKRTRFTYKTPLPYGNENIAAMILKTLSNKGDSIFPSSSNADVLQHNKCGYCDKVFLNQLYLQSHIARRHAEVLETPQREKQVTEQNNENAKMSAEIMELRTKLKEMEQAIANANAQSNAAPVNEVCNTPSVAVENIKSVAPKNTKDAEVSTNTEEYLLNKFEQWKAEEHAKYNKEINDLRTQILETINSIKEKQEVPHAEPKENTIIEQLHNTIKEQGIEILKLKQDLVTSQKEQHREEAEKNKETEAQISFWSKRAEAQSKQYEALLQKLNDVAKDAKESRALAEMERERATELQSLLQQSINKRAYETVTTSTDDLIVANHDTNHKSNHVKVSENKKANNVKHMTDRHTLENLHKKAQELLNIGSISSTSSDSSSSPLEEIRPVSKKDKRVDNSPLRISNSNTFNKSDPPKPKQRNHTSGNAKVDTDKVAKNKVAKPKTNKNKPIAKTSKESSTITSGSPNKVVRAKLTEEVNNRLVTFGVDPLKSRLPRNAFQKQKIELQQLHESKIKKNHSYEKVRHSILAFLDSSTSITNKEVNCINEYVSPNKINKPFKSLTSVISNVKSKALSLVKINENNKEKRKPINSEVAKRVLTLMSTPPSSAPESPVNVRSSSEKRSHNKYKHDNANRMKSKQNHEVIAEVETKKNNQKQTSAKELRAQVLNFDSEEESNESDHKYHNTAVMSESSKSIENLIKSPARRPASADNSNNMVRKYAVENGDLFTRTQSIANLSETNAEINNSINKLENFKNENSSDDVESMSDTPLKKALSDEHIKMVKHTKGVLKNASSVSSLNKKKVLFDMDAIQMKSVSASPSQSITEKSDGNEKYELGLVNLDGEEWDISSIENEPLKNDTKIQINQINTRTSPKIAELKQTIESQLARRNDTPSTAIVGGVDILAGPIPRVPSIGGSNTSLGSSILDESDGIPTINHKAFVKPRKVTEKDDSELDISEFSIDGIANKNESF